MKHTTKEMLYETSFLVFCIFLLGSQFYIFWKLYIYLTLGV